MLPGGGDGTRTHETGDRFTAFQAVAIAAMRLLR